MIASVHAPPVPGERFDLTCADCGAAMKHRRCDRYKNPFFYGCSAFPRCRATHGAHPDGKPLGTPANQETKRARIAAHAAFDPLWQLGFMHRSQAYGWLARAMGFETHMGELTANQCARVVELCRAKLAEEQAVSPELRALRSAVRSALRGWGRGRVAEARAWAAGVVGAVEWPGTDTLSAEQLEEILRQDAARKSVGARPAGYQHARGEDVARKRAQEIAKRLTAGQMAVLRSFARGPRAWTDHEHNDVNRLGPAGFACLAYVKDDEHHAVALEITRLGRLTLAAVGTAAPA